MKNLDSAQPQEPQTYRPPQASGQISLLSRGNKPKKPRRVLKIISGLVVLSIITLLVLAVFRAANLSDKIFVGRKLSFFQKIVSVFQGSTGQVRLVGEDSGQVNILILGIGGEGHDGPYLTDTMIVAQIRPDNGEVVMTSIPRDLWADMPQNSGQAKINMAFSDGYLKHRDYNEAGQWAITAAQNVTGLTIPYFAVADFSGFEKAVNQVGGLDIKVDRAFTDYQYPDSGTGYLPPQTFTAGLEHMDGARALIFARSRHADGPEGSDFARSARQQKVISAFKQKVLNLNLITDVTKLNDLLGTLADHFHTNISPAEMFRIYSLSKQNNFSNILSLSLDPSTNLICPQIQPDTNAYILTDCPGKTDADIHSFFKNAFAIGKLSQEKAVVWLASSNHNSVAYENANRTLTEAGLTVWEFNYAGQALPQNIFYEVNAKPATAEFLKNSLGATEQTLPPPNLKLDRTKVDVVIILGGNNTVPEQP